MKKLIEIQKRLKAPKGQYNDFGKYKYRSCEDILEAVKPLCSELEVALTLTDEIIQVGERVYVKSTVTFIDGDKTLKVDALAREAEIQKGMSDPQITGSASSYARKFALSGLFLIDDTRDADSQDNSGSDYIDDKEKGQLIDMMADVDITEERMCAFMQIESIDKMYKKDYKRALVALENKKKEKNNA